MRKLIPILLSFVLATGCEPQKAETLAASQEPNPTADKTPEATEPEAAPAEAEKTEDAPYAKTVVEKNDIAVIETSMGTMKAKFYLDKAPNHAKNFVYLAKKGFYDGTKFHRIIKGFMIQGGDPNTKPGGEKNGPAGTGGPGYMVPNEFNDVEHMKGVLSMARSQDPDSAGSQFFVVHERAPHLDGSYTAFGELTAGKDVLDKIANVKTGAMDAPVNAVVIKSIKIVKG
jgi:cyclophilin family peptidyl-prolyl cis-trans isomerase